MPHFSYDITNEQKLLTYKIMIKQKRISAVILDCDGVMFDSRRANTNFYNHLLAHFGLPPMREDDITFVHAATAEESVRHIFRETPYRRQAEEYRKGLDYFPFIKDMIIEPGLKKLLMGLKPEVGLAVATNRSNTIGAVLEQNGLEEYFDIVVSSLDVENPKPHPESIMKILDFFGLDPLQAVYIGDSLIDLKTAEAAGVYFVAYRNGSLEASFKAGTMRELGEVLELIENCKSSETDQYPT